MFKKCASYLSICLLAVPLVATADEVPVDPESPLQLALSQLSVNCPAVAARTNEPAQLLLQAFYLQQNYAEVWRVDGRAAALQEQLQQLADDGLDPARYRVPTDSSVASDELCADIDISQHYLQALQDLHYGRLQQSRFEPLWHAEALQRDRQADLLAIASPGVQDIPGAFAQARPSLAQYQALRHVYAQQRLQALPDWQPVADGPLLRPDSDDKRVPELAKRLVNEGYLSHIPHDLGITYSGELVSAVKSFQLNHSLQSDGVIGPGTLAELNISPAMRREQLRINLERFRWMAQDLEPTSLLVNVAAAELTVYQGGLAVWQTRTQVGRAERQTPLLKSHVTRLTLNPTWTIPPTIMKEDKLPEIRKDSAFLSRHGLQVLDREGQPLATEDIDWEHPGNIMLRQDAGPKNPLGQMVVRFPNPYSVYLHDTPSQSLFAKGPRAFSSGCVRIEHALQLRDLLLSPAELARTDILLATKLTHEYRLTKPMPILMTYWTAQADSKGQVMYAPDIYGRDSVLVSAMAAAL